MIGRAFGIAIAIAVTFVGVTIAVALIVYSFFGSDILSRAWENIRTASRARVEQAELNRARGFSFFTTEPVKGHDFEITTGVRFSTLADLNAGRQQTRWCYVMLRPRGGGAVRQITLANQTGAAPPVFEDLSAYPETELRTLGVDASGLGNIARRQCRFCCPDGKTATVDKYEAAAARVRRT